MEPVDVKKREEDELVALYGEALDYAERMHTKLSTLHFLLAFFSAPCEAAVVFENLRVSYEDVAQNYNQMLKEAKLSGSPIKEPIDAVATLEAGAKRLLVDSSQSVSPTHILAAMANQRNSIAYKIFQRLDLVTDFRLGAMKLLNEPTRKSVARVEEMHRESTHVGIAGAVERREKQQVRSEEPSEGEETRSAGEPAEAELLFSRNLTVLAAKGAIDPVFGRSREIETIIDILGRKRSNNPLIVGPAGSGKTAIVEAIALRQNDGLLPDREILELNVSSLVSGTEYRGTLEKRVETLLDYVEKRADQIVVFIDEIHLLFSSGNDVVANMLKPALARGLFPLIGATTTEEFNKFISKDAAMERRFSVVKIDEPKGEELFKIVQNAAETLGKYHGVDFGDSSFIRAAINLSDRYISSKCQPDKVLSILDTLGSILKREQKPQAEIDDLTSLISSVTSIPAENLLIDTSRIITVMPKILDRSIIGQRTAKERISRLLARKFNNKPEGKPLASMILAGMTGTGKTETAKRLASFLFGSEKRMVAFDMSEFQEQHSVSKLIGAPPGYAGYEDGGKLTEAFRREPYQLLLLDEIDKAHPKVMSLFLQLLEEGRLTDTHGFTADFSEAIVVMTTNIGAELFTASRVGFGDSGPVEVREQDVISKIEKFLSPELLNRVDEIILFKPFTQEEFLKLAESALLKSAARVNFGSSKVEFENIGEAAELIVSKMSSHDRQMGARAVNRLVGKYFEGTYLEEFYNKNKDLSDCDAVCSVRDGAFCFEFSKGDE